MVTINLFFRSVSCRTLDFLKILPDYRHKGYARKMVKEYVSLKENEVNGFVLTCKDHLILFYESCGFRFKGVSKSVHGNAKWNDMVRINERER